MLNTNPAEIETGDNEALDLVLESAAQGLQPGDKCAHGNYIPRGYSDHAPYCSGCNAPSNDRVLAASMKRRKPACRAFDYERQMDAAEFMEQPASIRMAEMAQAMRTADGAL